MGSTETHLALRPFIAALLQAFVPEPPAWVAAQARKAHNPNEIVDAVLDKSSALARTELDNLRAKQLQIEL